MSVAKQLYQLQEVDLELESNEQALRQITSQLGESKAVVGARNKLALEHQHLDELKQQQHSIEWEIDDTTTKLSPAEEELYSGRIRNPKELTNLQHEIDSLKARRYHLEDKALEIMDQAELVTKSVATLDSKLKVLEAEWHSQQQELSTKLEQIKTMLSNLKHKRQLLADEIDLKPIELYQELRKQRGKAVAKVEQGMCRGCRISLPITELQQARSGSLVRCSSCGRILFLA
ncbi:zinc ribbon domain-containing protein [Chloroflexota bacterium]